MCYDADPMSDKRFHADSAHKLEDPERLRWMPPADVIRTLGARPGMTIADVGAGTGFFTLPIAETVGPAGRVFAVDAQDAMLRHLRDKLEREGAPTNVVVACAEADATGLPSESCDAALLANIWHELEDHGREVEEMRRILVPGGTLVVLDWRPDHVPPPGPPADHRRQASHAESALRAAGWGIERSSQLGVHSWVVVGRRSA